VVEEASSSLKACCITQTGKNRETNEDSLLNIQIGDTYITAIADGVGGHAAGEIASRLAIAELKRSLVSIPSGLLGAEMLEKAVLQANTAIYLMSRKVRAYSGMASTLVAAVVCKRRALIVNIGDCRAYLVGEQIKRITKDHSLVQQMVDNGTITPAEASVHSQRNLITMSLGIRQEIHPDLYEVDLAGNILLLCSDGLSDVLSDEHIRQIIAGSASLPAACRRLLASANAGGSTDDISVLLTG
jgi:PPM family protein phosphatase